MEEWREKQRAEIEARERQQRRYEMRFLLLRRAGATGVGRAFRHLTSRLSNRIALAERVLCDRFVFAPPQAQLDAEDELAGSAPANERSAKRP